MNCDYVSSSRVSFGIHRVAYECGVCSGSVSQNTSNVTLSEVSESNETIAQFRLKTTSRDFRIEFIWLL